MAEESAATNIREKSSFRTRNSLEHFCFHCATPTAEVCLCHQSWMHEKIQTRQRSATARTCSGPVRQQPPIHCAPALRQVRASSPNSCICPLPCQQRCTASHCSPELG